MCGIAGITGGRAAEHIVPMARALAHRGPDAEGFYCNDQIALGHRRLSVIDLKAGRQPMTTPDHRHTIVFNGEIYNFSELRRQLESLGVCFQTRSDTEVLLHAYASWGRDALLKLRGMFAFAVWDAHARSLFLARDRLGLKPLYFAEVGSSFLFASEIKGLLAHSAMERRLDPFALDDFLTYLYVPAPRTIFRGIQELPPGHYLEWLEGRFQMHRYWDLTFNPDQRPLAMHQEEIQATLSESVRMRLGSDVPVGVFLSGGLDSSVVTAIAAHEQVPPLHTFTLGFQDGEHRYNEWEYAREMGEAAGTHAQELCVPAQSANLLNAVTRHFDEPFGNPTALLVYQLSQLGSSRVKVALTGDGGDEAFLGYLRYQGVLLAEHYRKLPRSLRHFVSSIANCVPEPGNGNHLTRRVREFANGSFHLPETMYLEWISYFSKKLRQRLYSPELADDLGDYDSSHFVRDLFRRSGAPDIVDRVNYVDLHSFLPFNILRYADRMSMAHGLELRAPFTDHRLIEQLARVPRRYKLRGGQTKLLLRNAATHLVASKILNRQKIGFNPPMGLWLRGQLRPLLHDYLSERQLRHRGYFRSKVVQELIWDHLHGYRDYSLHLWALISFEEWHRQYLN